MRPLKPALSIIGQRYLGSPSTGVRWSEAAWSRAVVAAVIERLGPVLGESASATGTRLPDYSRALLTATRLKNDQLYDRQEAGLADLHAALTQASVPAVVIKGMSTARHYPVPRVRPVGDIDLLVPAAAVEAAHAALLAAGYLGGSHPGTRPTREYVMTYERGEGGEMLSVEVHPAWHELALTPDGSSVQIGGVTGALMEAELGGDVWHVLPPEAELYLAAAHTVLHNPRTLSLYLDMAVLLDAGGVGVLEEVREWARIQGRERHLKHSVSAACDLFGIEAPREELSLPKRLGVPASLRLGYLGFGFRFLPSTVVLEVAWRRGFRRKLAFLAWVAGHGKEGEEGGDGAPLPGSAWRRLLKLLLGVRWLKGVLLSYRISRSLALRP